MCSIEGCGLEHYAQGYCNAHYQRWKRNGHTQTVDDLIRKPLKSDNLRLPDISGALEANICSLIRSLPGKGK